MTEPASPVLKELEEPNGHYARPAQLFAQKAP
jgi:hypothetical protein